MRANSYDYRVETREVDLTQRICLRALIDQVLQTAGRDADRNGFGVHTLNQSNRSWVLSRLAFQALRLPGEGEHYSVQTWIEEVGRLMSIRNFVVRDSQGKEIGYGCSYWAMIDLESRQPVDLRTNVDYSKVIVAEPIPIERPKRLGAVSSPTLSREHQVQYSDIDFNGHTNTLRYIDWMMNMLPLELLTQGNPPRLDISFTMETRYNDLLEVLMQQEQECFHFEIKNQAGRSTSRAQFAWERE